MRVRNPILALVLAVTAAPLAHAQVPETSPQQAPPRVATPHSAPVGQTQNTTSNLPKKAKHVFTNEDFDAVPHEANVNGGRDLLEQVNSCDRSCFDQISRSVGSNYNLDTRWKQSILNAIDKSKEDLPWQGLLAEAISIQAQSCELQMKKKQDMDRLADPRTVTHKELLIDREYEPRFKEMTRRLNEVAARANARIRPLTDPFLAEYMRLQLNRVVNATCRIYVTQAPSRRDPEDTDAPDPEDASNEPMDDNR